MYGDVVAVVWKSMTSIWTNRMAVSKEIDVFMLLFDVQYDVEESMKENESEEYRSWILWKKIIDDIYRGEDKI